jgi:hypothetical protein
MNFKYYEGKKGYRREILLKDLWDYQDEYNLTNLDNK